MAKRLTRKSFESWLKEHQDDVFISQSPISCPIARYYSDNGYTMVVVGSRHRKFIYDGDYSNVVNRGWIKCFIDKFDIAGRHSEVPGSKALAILEDCK